MRASLFHSALYSLSLYFFLSVAVHVCVFWRLSSDLPSLWRGVCFGSRRPITAVTFRNRVKNHEEWENVTMRIQMRKAEDGVTPFTPTPCMWLTHQHPLASRPPPVAAKARFSVKHRVCDAWELTTELGALRAQPDQNQLGPCTLAKKP